MTQPRIHSHHHAEASSQPWASAYTRDLEHWLPGLIRIWRNKNNLAGPANRLLPQEVKTIAQSLQILSQGLTRDRELAGVKYFSDPALMGAYLLYFWPISYIQARYALQGLLPAPQRILELGSGAGPLSAAAADLGIQFLTLADRSPAALHVARQLAQGRQQRVEFMHWDPEKKPGRFQGQYDLISAQHVLNELWVQDPKRQDKILNLLLSLQNNLSGTGSLLLIDPALTPTARALLQIRDSLLAQQWQVIRPCLLQEPCPALLKSTDSCHMDLPWQAPQLVKQLAQAAGFRKKELKMSFFLFRPQGQAKPALVREEDFLIVSEPLLSKNKRIRYLGCGLAGRTGLALKPEEASEGNKVFLTLKRGDVIRISHAQKTEQGLRILPDTRIHLLKRL